MRKDHGFTFIEQLITTLIIGIVVAIAHVVGLETLKKIEAHVTTMRLESFLKSARTYALLHHQALTICGSQGVNCDNQWSTGILLLTDSNRNGVVDGSDRILEYIPLNLKAATLSWRGFGGSRLVIESFGTTFAGNGTFTYCPISHNPRYIRQIVINRGGRVRLSQDRDHDGIHENANGSPLTCF